MMILRQSKTLVTGTCAALSLLWVVSCGSGSQGGAPTTPASVSTPPAAALDPTPPPTTAPPATMAPQPTPVPTPAACPPLTKWGSKIHNILDAQLRQVETPVVGGTVLVDSTPRFNDKACNMEHDNCGGRQCEDPRGGDWTLLEGTSPAKAVGGGYQFRIGPLQAGTHSWRVCPLPDLEDGEGDPVEIGPNPCSEGAFDVQ